MESGHNIPDHYAVLEIEDPDTVDDDEIKRNYRRISLLTHPDKNPHDPTATARFQQLLEARGTLLDPIKRSIYDIERRSTRPSHQTAAADDDVPFWAFWRGRGFFKREPRSYGAAGARMPGETRGQRADNTRGSEKEWYSKEQARAGESVNMREEMRAKQKETNVRIAREREQAKRTREANEQKAWENQQQRVREMREKGPSAASSGHAKHTQIFRNLPGSSCEHRGYWDMVEGAQTCHCCCRTMPKYVYRCRDCSMLACKRCMKAVRKGGSR